MRLLPSRIFPWVCLFLFLTQTAFVDARSKKEKKKIQEEVAPDPVNEEEESEPASSSRDARQPTSEHGKDEGPIVNPEQDQGNENVEGSERTKKSYCASERSHDGNYNGHPHGHPPPPGHGHGQHGPYGRSDDHYPPDADHYHGGGHGSGYEQGHPHAYMSHGHDMTDYHHQGHGYDGPEGYGGDGGKGHVNPGYARKSQGDYGYGGQGSKGGELYHAAASAPPSSVYRPSYQSGHDSYGGDYPSSYGYGGQGPSYAANSYGPHPYAPGYSAGNLKAAYGGGVPSHFGAYGPAGQAYGGSPVYGPMYHGPSGYPPAGYAPHSAYGPYMPYSAPSSPYPYGSPYPMSPYHPYGYSPPPPYPYPMHRPNPGIPVTLTCSLQQHDAPYGYPPHPRGGPYYRASDNEPHPNKPPLVMTMIPPNMNKTQKPNEKQPMKEQKDGPIHEAEKNSQMVMGHQGKPEPTKGDSHHGMQAMGGGSGGGSGGGGGGGGGGGEGGGGRGGGMEHHPSEPRESAVYQRIPFSVIRQRQMESLGGPKPVFYQQSY